MDDDRAGRPHPDEVEADGAHDQPDFELVELPEPVIDLAASPITDTDNSNNGSQEALAPPEPEPAYYTCPFCGLRLLTRSIMQYHLDVVILHFSLV